MYARGFLCNTPILKYEFPLLLLWLLFCECNVWLERETEMAFKMHFWVLPLAS